MKIPIIVMKEVDKDNIYPLIEIGVMICCFVSWYLYCF